MPLLFEFSLTFSCALSSFYYSNYGDKLLLLVNYVLSEIVGVLLWVIIFVSERPADWFLSV
jgi:hypothetical protein